MAAETGEIAFMMCHTVSSTVNTSGVTTTHAGRLVIITATNASTRETTARLPISPLLVEEVNAVDRTGNGNRSRSGTTRRKPR